MEAIQPQPPQQAQAQAQAAPRRREVVVGGRRVKTIDVHAHCVVPKALELMGRTTSANQSRGPGINEVGLRRIGEMDAQGIDVEAISINPFWYRAERDLAADVIKVNNETLTAWCAAHPDRFLGFASVALQFPDLAVQQLSMPSRRSTCAAWPSVPVAGDEFSDPKFHPFWAKCEALGILVFIHPQSIPDLAPRLQGNGWLANTIGNPLDTTIALSHLIFEGTLDRFPGLKICAAHGGGYLPAYAPRSDQSLRVAPDMDTGVQLREAADRVPAHDVLRHAGVHLRSAAASRRRGGREAAGDRHGPPDTVAG